MQFQSIDKHRLYLEVRLSLPYVYIGDWIVLAFHEGFVGMVGKRLLNHVAGLEGQLG
jgi:hypothetical protein